MNKTSSQLCHDELSQLFETQISDLRAFNRFLTRLKNAVAENDIDGINNLVAQQKLPTAEIEKSLVKQQKLAWEFNFEANNTGLEKCINWCDEGGTLVRQYEEFKQELVLLQRSLQISNLLVSKGRNRVRQSLQLLTGQTANTRVYTSSGQSQDSTDGRSIAHA